MTEPIENHRLDSDQPGPDWASPDRPVAESGTSGWSGKPAPGAHSGQAPQDGQPADPTGSGPPEGPPVPIRITLPPGIRPIQSPGTDSAVEAVGNGAQATEAAPPGVVAPAGWRRPGDLTAGQRDQRPTRQPVDLPGALAQPGGQGQQGVAVPPDAAWSRTGGGQAPAWGQPGGPRVTLPGAGRPGGPGRTGNPVGPGVPGPGGWPGVPAGGPAARIPSGLFPSGPPRPTYREPHPVRSSAVAAGVGSGLLWMLLFGLLASTGRAYAWWTIIAGAVAWLVALALGRFGDRGVAIGVAASSAVGVGIAGIVVLADLIGGHWLLW